MGTIGQIEYDRQALLGVGGFAHVFSGTFPDEHGKRFKVAVKRIFNSNVNTDEREADALNKLKDHPNVIRLYGSEKDFDFYYFALERCAASMDDIFLPENEPKKYKGPLPSDLDVLLELSEGLKYIHENGFVHRDVKPGNVLISYPKEDGTVVMKWADFGLCKSVSSGGSFSISGQRGTINWIAPEILAVLGDEQKTASTSEPRGTVESDTWSAGCVFCAYLTKGRHPFGGNNLDIVQNISKSYPINLAAFANDHFAANMIKEMIQKERMNRMKLSDVVHLLKKEKDEEIRNRQQQQEQGDNVRRKLEADRLYSWEQWNLALNKDGQLYVWSEDVAIQGISNEYYAHPRIKLNESDTTTIASVQYGGALKIEGKESGRKDLNREMLQMAGITPGTPSKSLNDHHFESQGKEWVVYTSKLGDHLIISGILQEKKVLLFGVSFHSTCHVFSAVCMTDGGKKIMGDELLDLCSLPIPEPKELDRIAALLQVGVDPNCTNTQAQTPLLLCMSRQERQLRLQCLKILLKANLSEQKMRTVKKVNLDFKDNQQRNALHLLLMQKAGMSDDPTTVFESMELLVNGGIDVDSKNDFGQTALHLLCQNCQNGSVVDAMELLIDKGAADVNVKDNGERTALHYLCENYKNENIVQVMKILLEHGVDVVSKDKGERTALHFLCSNYQNVNVLDAMELLMEKGVHVHSQDGAGRNALHWLCQFYKKENIVDAMKTIAEKGVEANVKASSGQTPLHYLCENYGNENIVDPMKFLIDKGVHVDLKDKNGRTALDFLCQKYKNENIVDAMKILIEAGVDVHSKDKDGRTALHWLCEKYNNKNIVHAMKILIEKGIDVHSKDADGRAALHFLCKNKKNENIVDAMKFLVENGIDVNLKGGKFGRTALHFLCEYYKKENLVDAMKLLAENGIDMDSKDKSEKSALHHLCLSYKEENIVDALKLFIDNGAEMDSKDKDGCTALHFLCENYDRENILDAMELLIKKGSDVNLEDRYGKTALGNLGENPKLPGYKEKFLQRIKE